MNGKYGSAQQDFRFFFSVDICNDWESFLPISAEELAGLRRVLTHSWHDVVDQSVIPRKLIALGPKFVLHIGSKEVDLLDNLPIVDAIKGNRINLKLQQSTSRLVAEKLASAPLSSALKPRIWIRPLGNVANRALQYLVAEGIRAHVPDASIQNLHLPEWRRVSQEAEPAASVVARTGRENFWVDVPGLGAALKRGSIEAIILDSYAFNIDHYPPRSVARQLLGPMPSGSDARGFGVRQLVCSLRGGEVLRGIHPDYFVLPPAYYQMLEERTGLELVFFGQIGDDPYTESLRRAFPNSTFIAGRSAQYDFETLRRSANIALSISTFAWLAAWLSEAQSVFVPIGGIFSPIQQPNQMFLPVDEPGYEFILLPYCKSVALLEHPKDFGAQQDLLGQSAQWISGRQAHAICLRSILLNSDRPYVGGFDPAYYVQSNPDVAGTICKGTHTALEHYLRIGRRKMRPALHMDETAYLGRYPDVGIAIAHGFFTSPMQHYVARGWAKGYCPEM